MRSRLSMAIRRRWTPFISINRSLMMLLMRCPGADNVLIVWLSPLNGFEFPKCIISRMPNINEVVLELSLLTIALARHNALNVIEPLARQRLCSQRMNIN